ncbi:aminotransferase class V-fold PLP-dependent enzyme [uncultured Fusobacterium sp.]|uniref:aminotransferase class V-fold PLP-dependent enzyme n=1 Tax=uncultured Fusobacterium sp. TaxID=159267 RepID=UPI0025E23A84|nr:aminotransferase class V-fold PLP-dependent enzyme [uncultured Fusobacterium sp.]
MVAYFDNSATTFPKPEEVYSFMDKFYRENGVNVGRGQHKLASKASFLVDETRKLLLEILHCKNKGVIFTSTATEGINLVLQGREWKENSIVYISPFEHNAVTRTLFHLKDRYSLKIKRLAFNREKIEYDLEQIKADFKEENPDVVICSHSSNVFGIVAPVEKIVEESKKYGAFNFIDMCQTAGLIDLNVGNENIDAIVFAGHKTLYGPLGVSGVVMKKDIDLKPLIYGGTGVESANQNMPDIFPIKYEGGSHNILAISGLNASLKWLKNIGIENIYKKEKEIFNKLISLLKNYENIEIVGYREAEEQVGVVSCVFKGYAPDEIGQVLSDMDIAVRTGLHCSPYAHEFFGTFPAGTVRLSVSYFTTDDELDKLKVALDYIRENS